MVADTAYIPASGVAGKVQRLKARALARRPARLDLDRPLVSFSFDDFPRSAATEAAPRLEAQGWRGTFYAAAGMAGGANHLGRLYDLGDLHRLARSGHEIGCHTYAHFDAARMDADALAAEVDRNARCLRLAGYEGALASFAFPYGEATPQAKARLASRFLALRGVRPGVNRTGSDLNLLSAVPLDGGEAGLAAALRQLDAAARRPGWIIFYGHDVRETPSEWGCTPAFFETVVDAVAATGAEVVTVREGARRAGAAA
mgnify:CR=1 FL=1